ncbi:MAG: hypothetical protein GF353_08410 [Candidatus Lokiarchaeota archaeon]|nr:hypothetical protein [Candidatus Lokiarchaeota archaeon]
MVYHLKYCDKHNLEYNYICPKCIKPLLLKTQFSDLFEIRQYQRDQSTKISEVDLKTEYRTIGIIKIRFKRGIVHTGILIYDLNERIVIDEFFEKIPPKFTNYLPSILFLNWTEIYLQLIKNSGFNPDCYIVNSSGKIHPYLCGAACELGLRLDSSIIGYTKSLLFGVVKEMKNLKLRRQSIWGVFHEGNLLGYRIPKPNSTKHFYISVGNNISLESALKIFLNLDFKLFSLILVKIHNFFKK